MTRALPLLCSWAVLAVLGGTVEAAEPASLTVRTAPVRRAIGLELPWVELQVAPAPVGTWTATVAGLDPAVVTFTDGQARLQRVTLRSCQLRLSGGAQADLRCLSGPASVAPALLAIVLALWVRQVLVALFAGIVLGAWLLGPTPGFVFAALDLVIEALADPDHAKVVVFTLLMGGLVGLVTANGGARGLILAFGGGARSARQGMLTTWGLGLLVFIDDYASSLMVGSTMRPVTDRLRISREKLSYIVDSTSAPITSLALVSTWVGYELSVMQEALTAANLDYAAYPLFLEGLSARFYPWLALVMVALVAWTGRDFGPMWHAEHRARTTGQLLRPGGSPLLDAEVLGNSERAAPRAWLGAVPVAVLLGTVGGYLAWSGWTGVQQDPEAWAVVRQTGWLRSLGALLGAAASFDALLYGSGLSVLAGVGVTAFGRALPLPAAIEAVLRGIRATLLAVIVLLLAWSIGEVMTRLQAGPYLAQVLGPSLPLWSYPTLTFLCAGLLAFSTGTSWGTMAILFPVVLPLLAVHQEASGFETILVASCSSVLAGAVFGDHCSPISDTTVLSSVACAADHVDHTRTQAPYALTVATVSVLVGTLPAGWGLPSWIGLLGGIVLLFATVRVFGRLVASPVTPRAPGRTGGAETR